MHSKKMRKKTAPPNVSAGKRHGEAQKQFRKWYKMVTVNYGCIRFGNRNSSIGCIEFCKYNSSANTNCKNVPFDIFVFGLIEVKFGFVGGKGVKSAADWPLNEKKPSNKSHILDLFSLLGSALTKTNVKIGILTIRNFSAFTNTYIKWMPFRYICPDI